jgi:hypothetical protein
MQEKIHSNHKEGLMRTKIAGDDVKEPRLHQAASVEKFPVLRRDFNLQYFYFWKSANVLDWVMVGQTGSV